MFRRQKDMRAEPVKRVVALGESTTWGYSVSEKSLCWVNQVVQALGEFQGAPIELVNQGIGSNVLTPLFALRSNFTDREPLRQRLRMMPKFGHGHAEADAMAQRVTRTTCGPGRPEPASCPLVPWPKLGVFRS